MNHINPILSDVCIIIFELIVKYILFPCNYFWRKRRFLYIHTKIFIHK